MEIKDNSVKFINILMGNINSLTDDIYESLMDGDYKSLDHAVKEIKSLLTEVQKTYQNEI